MAKESSNPQSEKSPVSPEDYAGLQVSYHNSTTIPNEGLELDMRSFPNRSSMSPSEGLTPPLKPCLFENWVDKTQSYGQRFQEMEQPASRSELAKSEEMSMAMKETVQHLASPHSHQVHRPWHTQRRWLLLGALVVIVVAAATVGGILGAQHAAYSSPTTSPTSTPSATTPSPAAPSIINANLPKSDVMVGSPLASIAFSSGGSDDVDLYNLFYQLADGNMQQSTRSGLGGSWTGSDIILTDLMNGTGICVIEYPNGTNPQLAIFYIGSSNSRIREKRVSTADYWNLGPLTPLHIPVNGNDSTVGDGGMAGLRLTAVYSQDFGSGPGTRLFYHQSNETTNFVQELIWFQNNDSWIYGAQLTGPHPGSYLSAVIEPQSQSLRLFYSTPDNAIQELHSNITMPSLNYEPGLTIPQFLLHSSSDFSVISTTNSTLIYYASHTSQGANITINELALSPLPDLSTNSLQSSLVAIPALAAEDMQGENVSYFVPIGAVTSPDGDAITVFYPEDVVDPRSGYSSLKAVTRRISNEWGNSTYGQTVGMTDIPLRSTDE